MSSPDRSPSLSDLAELDWDFSDTTISSPFAQFHWHPARFPPQIPAVVIRALSQAGDLVLDPFSGCGTTLVEALRQDRRAIGIDTNPVAGLITAAKVIDCDVAKLEAAATDLLIRVEHAVNATSAADVDIPKIDEQSQWYEPRTLIELGNIWHEIGEVPDAVHRLIFTASFSAILRFVCSQEQHWGWICDNVKPKYLTHRSAVSKFAEKMREYLASARQLRPSPRLGHAEMLTGRCSEVLAAIQDDVVTLVVTSPPYFGVTDYAKAQRLTCLWLGIEVEQVRQAETGARSKRHRKTSADQYIDEMTESFSEITRVLRPGGHAVVVIGESATRDPILPDVSERLSGTGLKLATTIQRRLPTQRGKNASLANEQVWIFQRD